MSPWICPAPINLCKKDVKLTLSQPFQSVAENSIAWLGNWQKVKVPFLFKVDFTSTKDSPPIGNGLTCKNPPKRLVVR